MEPVRSVVTSLRSMDLVNENIHLQKQMQGEGQKQSMANGTRYTFKDLLYASPVMEQLVRQAEKAAKSDCAVLVYGETGTGKEVLQERIYNRLGANKEQPLSCRIVGSTNLDPVGMHQEGHAQRGPLLPLCCLHYRDTPAPVAAAGYRGAFQLLYQPLR